MNVDETRVGTALVLVRATSPFLSDAVLTHREQACVTLAQRFAANTQVVAGAAGSRSGSVDRLYEHALAARAPAVITWSAHGLVTSPSDLVLLTRLLDEGCELYEASSGTPVRITADRLADALTARAERATEQRREHAARTRAGRRDVARQGRWLGGRRPLGWIVDDDGAASLEHTAAAHIRSGTQRIAAGGSIGTVVAVWNNAGFTTLTGQRWTFGSTRRVILRARNAGLVEYRGEIVARSEWPAIVTVREWSLARRRLETQSVRQMA